eukprot:ANDGO_08631.mRNA.1 putative cation-transporting ATPase C1672.11c
MDTRLLSASSASSVSSYTVGSTFPIYYPLSTRTEEDDDVLSITSVRFFTKSPLKRIFFTIFSVIFAGIPSLVLYWFPNLRLKCLYSKSDVVHADACAVQGGYGPITILDIFLGPDASSPLRSAQFANSSTVNWDERWFVWRCQKYVFRSDISAFEPSRFTYRVPVSKFLNIFRTGIESDVKSAEMIHLYGRNLIEVPIKSIPKLLVEEVLHPFFVFQLFAVVLWLYDTYTVYALTILFLAITSAIVSLVETRSNMKRLSRMARFDDEVLALRGSGNNLKWETIMASQLVPGDVIQFRDNMKIPCDLLLTDGECVVDESQLTGESTPVVRSPVPDEDSSEINMDRHKKHLMFSGTTILQTRPLQQNGFCTGIVLRTGFSTLKGQLIRAIMFPRPHSFSFYKDAFAFIGVLAVLAIIGFGISLFSLLEAGTPVETIVVRALDVLVITVPPALPLGLAVSTVFSLKRLKKKRIFCISPSRLNMAGKTSLCVFDKTGTLTVENLEFDRFVPCQKKSKSAATMSNNNTTGIFMSLDEAFRQAVVTCHSVSELRGVLIGDPLDLIIFDQTNWQIAPHNNVGSDEPVISRFRPRGNAFKEHYDNLEGASSLSCSDELGIIRRFEFSSETQRMATLYKVLGNPKSTMISVKGSPEMVCSFCAADSLPPSLDQCLRELASQGLRVIAYAGRDLGEIPYKEALQNPREAFETNLVFYGLVVLVNRVKVDTPQVISELRCSGIRTVMATGDNVFTGVSVARQCNIVPDNLHIYVSELVPVVAPLPPLQKVSSSTKARKHQDSDPREGVIQDGSPHETYDSSTDVGKAAPKMQVKWILMAASSGAMASVAGLPETCMDWKVCPDHCEFAISGSAFHILEQTLPVEEVQRLLMRTHIMARMSPANKTRLVEVFQNLGYTVAMCGDGANDCGALKQAHFGVSLSEAEASIAAPFTSQDKSIRCVVDIIREGRASLATSFQLFKYMALYSVIQMTSVVLLYQFHDNLGDWQFLYIDLFLVLPITILMGRTKAANSLVNRRPSGKLLSTMVLFSFFFHFLVQLAFQAYMFLDVRKQSFYEKYDPIVEEKKVDSMENTTIFLLSCFIYVSVAVALSISKPFRLPIWTNVSYFIAVLIITGFNLFLLFYSSSSHLNDISQLVDTVPESYRIKIALVAILQFVISFLGERVFTINVVKRAIKRVMSCSCCRKPRQRKLYKTIVSAADGRDTKVFRGGELL